MRSYIARRLVYAILTFFGITIATFSLIHLVPGDPISFFIGKAGPGHMPQAVIQAIRHENHLDEPLPLQYWYWLRGVVTLDFGRSIVDHRPVVERIAEKLPNTLALNLGAFILAAAIGVPIGLWSATRSGRRVERATAVGFFLLYSLPSFWVALLLMQWFAVRLQILPLFGMTSDSYLEMSNAHQFVDRTRHFILPVITLSYAQLAIFARFSKSALTEAIRQDFITTARAKRATMGAVLGHHALR